MPGRRRCHCQPWSQPMEPLGHRTQRHIQSCQRVLLRPCTTRPHLCQTPTRLWVMVCRLIPTHLRVPLSRLILIRRRSLRMATHHTIHMDTDTVRLRTGSRAIHRPMVATPTRSMGRIRMVRPIPAPTWVQPPLGVPPWPHPKRRRQRRRQQHLRIPQPLPCRSMNHQRQLLKPMAKKRLQPLQLQPLCLRLRPLQPLQAQAQQ